MAGGHKTVATGEAYPHPLVALFDTHDQDAGLFRPSYPVYLRNGHTCQGAGSFALNTVVAVRPPSFRFGREGDERETTDSSDVQETNLHLMERDLAEVASQWLEKIQTGYRPTTGSEAEKVMVRKDNTYPATICPEGVPEIAFSDELQQIIKSNPAFFAPEFSSDMIETTDPYGSNLEQVYDMTTWQHAVLHRDLDRAGVRIAPFSVLPYGANRENVSRDRYVNELVFDFMTWERAQYFTGSSRQIHVEMLDPRAANAALNWFEQISPVLMAGTLSAPFWEGKVLQDCKSSRHRTRVEGSPSGGPFSGPLPVDSEEILRLSDKKIRDNEIPTPDRVAGHHTNRPRYTKGTIEICDYDNFGDRPERGRAYQEVTRNILTRLQLEYLKDEGVSIRKHWGHLFSLDQLDPDLSLFTPEGRHHANRELVSAQGADAVVTGADGNQYQTRSLMHGLMKFADEMFELSEETKTEFAKAYCSREKLEEMFARSRDKNGGIVDPYDYYELGYGTMADWTQELAKDLRSQQELDGIELTRSVVHFCAEAHHRRWDQIREELDLAA